MLNYIQMRDFIKNFIIFILFLIFGGLISVLLQQLATYDFASYHFHNGWAFLNNRIESDFMPAYMRSYFNPLLDGLSYFLITSFNKHPVLFYFITGFKFGMFMFISYLYLNLLYDKKIISRAFTTVAYLILILFSPVLIHNIAWDWIDIQINNIILIGFYIYIKNIYENYSIKRQVLLFISLLLVGIAIGLKYTAFIYFVSILICYLFNLNKIAKPGKTLCLLLAGSVIGFIITDGWWMLKIYKIFHNPIFPYLNNIFHSSFGTNENILGGDFEHIRPNNIFSFLFTPFSNSISKGYEWNFVDLKIPLAFCFILYYFILKIKKIDITFMNNIINPSVFNTFILFIITIYYLNLFFFGQLRYILALIPLICLIFIALIQVHSALAKEQPTENNIFLFIMLFYLAGIVYYPPRYIALKYFALFCISAALIYLIYVYFSKRFSAVEKTYNITTLLIILLVIATVNIPGYNPKSFELKGDIIKIRDAGIEDNAAVLCGSGISCFIAPLQNPNAKYAAYGVQEIYYSQIKKYITRKSRLPYNSQYMINETEKIFKNYDNIYFVISLHNIGHKKTFKHEVNETSLNSINHNSIYNVLKNSNIEKSDLNINNMTILDLYEKSLQDYSGREVILEDDCRILEYSIIRRRNLFGYYLICKIK